MKNSRASGRLYQGAIGTDFLALASDAALSPPDGVELFGQGRHQRRVVGQDSILEIPSVLVLCSQPRPCQVRTAEIRVLSIGDEAFEMNARAEHTLQLCPQAENFQGISVKICMIVPRSSRTSRFLVPLASCFSPLQKVRLLSLDEMEFSRKVVSARKFSPRMISVIPCPCCR